MSKFSFKSVGRSAEDVLTEQLALARSPLGVVTPLRLAGFGSDVFAMTYSLADMVHDNLRNLLLTNRGERLVLTGYGANLKPLAAEYTNLDDFDAVALERIRTAVTTWMPYVDLDSYESVIAAGAIIITIAYNVPMINVIAKKLQIIIRAT